MKNASLKKRIFSYIFDSLIIFVLISLVGLLFDKGRINELNKELNLMLDLFMQKKITFQVYFDEAAILFQKLDLEKALLNVLNIFFILIYFVIIPYIFDGITLGKKIFKIKIMRNDENNLTMANLILRNIIDTGIIYTLVSLMLSYILSSKPYFIISIIFSVIQIILLIVNVIMIKKREDKRGLDDIISNTKTVEVIKWKNIVNKSKLEEIR